MANLATYQQAASSIYDPQQQAEIAQANQKEQNALTSLDAESKSIEPVYQQALRGLNDQVSSNEAKLNQLYSSRLGGQFSGLQGNDMGMMYSKADQNRATIETTRADKLASIAARRTGAQQQLATDTASITGKYSGQKAQYAQNAYQAALKGEQDQAYRDKQLAVQSARAASSSAASAKPSTQQFLTQAFSGYKPAYEGGTAYYTEHEVIPALMANYGINQKDAANMAYEYRKQIFGEGYGSMGR